MLTTSQERGAFRRTNWHKPASVGADRRSRNAAERSRHQWHLAPIDESEDQAKDEREDQAPDNRDVPPEEELHDRKDQNEYRKMRQPTSHK
jgi:hypothetical protein